MVNGRDAILIVFPFCLDEIGHGNIQRTLNLSRYLSSQGYDVDVAYQGRESVARVEAQYSPFRRIYDVRDRARSSADAACRDRLIDFYGGRELPAAHFIPSAPLTALVRGLLEAEAYRAVISSYAWTAPMFAGLARRVLTVCDLHDVIHQHAAACREATGLSTSFSLPTATETFLWRQWDVLLAISPEDRARVERDTVPSQRVITIGHAASRVAPVASPGRDDVALYAGSDNDSNVRSVSWLLDHVWPLVREARPAARLRIAGLVCRALPPSARSTPGVDLLAFQPDLDAEIQQSGVFVAPYLYGSGVKIKVVEAACQGKAIVTTAAGAAGTTLDPYRSIVVEDQPRAFAGALIELLGDKARRTTLGAAARSQAEELFTPQACYAPLLSTLDIGDPNRNLAASHGLSPLVVDRVRAVFEDVRPGRLVAWGNGAHTRGLIAALTDLSVPVAMIVDGRAPTASTSVEGLPVVPAGHFAAAPDDLIVLSSEAFEYDMWQDLAERRDQGASVLGIYHPRHISAGLLSRLSMRLRVRFRAAPFERRRATSEPAIVFWDSQATPARWWHLGALSDSARKAQIRGWCTVLVTHASLAWRPDVLADLPVTATVAPILELDSRSLEARDPEGGVRSLTRLIDLAATTTARALSLLTLSRADRLVLMSPSLSECLGTAQALRAGTSAECPMIALDASSILHEGESWLHLTAIDRLAYWKLAVAALADACDGRLTLIASNPHAADEIRARLNRPVEVMGHPGHVSGTTALRHEPSRRRILCFGHAGAPSVRPMMEAIAEIRSTHDVTIAWRSNQNDGPRGSDDHWANGLASLIDVELLDDEAPSVVRARIADADAIVVLTDATTEPWAEAVCAQAAAAGVAIVAASGGLAARWLDVHGGESGRRFTPGDPQDLVAQIRVVLDPSRTKTVTTVEPATSMETLYAAVD